MAQYTRWPVPGGGGGGGGTVTSVNIISGSSSIFSVAGVPITTSGSAVITFLDQSGNTVLASPANGSLGAPLFRSLVSADIPSLLSSKILDFQTTVSANTDVAANTAARHNAITLGTANGLSLAVQVLSLQAADGTHTGALTSADWTAFNSKQSALTPGSISTSTTGVSIGSGAASTVGPNVTVNVQTASGSQPGLLSSADWTTFNGKQAAGSYITALTSDVTASGPGSVAATIANNVVTNAKLAQMAANTIKGNNTGGTANALDLTSTQVAAFLSNFTTIGLASATTITQMNGGIYYTTRTIAGNLTLDTTTTDYIVLCNQSGAINITFPAPVNGRVFVIKDISGTALTNPITMVRNGSEKIEGIAASKILQTNWGAWTFTTDGTDWFMV